MGMMFWLFGESIHEKKLKLEIVSLREEIDSYVVRLNTASEKLREMMIDWRALKIDYFEMQKECSRLKKEISGEYTKVDLLEKKNKRNMMRIEYAKSVLEDALDGVNDPDMQMVLRELKENLHTTE